MASDETSWLIAGLGNPGGRYSRTRHNIGWMALDELSGDEAFREVSKFEAAVARKGTAWLVKPLTFMNLSGFSVRGLASYYKIPATRVLVVLDDSSLPFGRLRIRPSGSPGGHNGLESVIVKFGTEAIPRLRIGIGAPPPPVSLHDHVLGIFTPSEQEALPGVLSRTTDAIQKIIKNGLAVAMNEFNKGGL